jgi:hypothetical protein
MTREQAADLVSDLLAACIDYEQCDQSTEDQMLQSYLEKMAAVINALTATAIPAPSRRSYCRGRTGWGRDN